MTEKLSWTIADVLDFETLLDSDSAIETAALRQRDQDFLAHEIAHEAAGESGTSGRAALFRRWLESRRAASTIPLPGAHFSSGWQTLITLALIAGLLLGGGLTGTLLHYKGTEPVNVAIFLGWTVGVQMLVLFTAILFWLVRSATTLFDDFHPLRALLAGLLWALGAGLRRLPGETREAWRASFARLWKKREIYGGLLAWPLLIITQLFAVAYNCGILAVLLAHVATTDLAFGWQSTLHASPEQVFHLVSASAAPWSWLVPNAHPTFSQVVESRFQYSAGLRPLSQNGLTSWWPYLAYCVLVYGLLVRGSLLIFASVKLRSGLQNLAFDHPAGHALLRRLSRPMIQAQPDTARLEIPASSSVLSDDDLTESSLGKTAREALPEKPPVVLRASDLQLEEAEIGVYVKAHFHRNPADFLSVEIDHPSGNLAALEALGKIAEEVSGALVFVRAHRPPIKAMAISLEQIAAALRPRSELVLILVGRRAEGKILEVPDAEFTHWRNFTALHGQRYHLERWSAA